MPKLRSIVVLVSGVIAIAAAVAWSQSDAPYIPPNGFVPDEATAGRIAEAVWLPIYGQAQIEAQKPFTVTLNADIWTVTGKAPPPGSFGGVAEADISKRDGRIIRVVHGR